MAAGPIRSGDRIVTIGGCPVVGAAGRLEDVAMDGIDERVLGGLLGVHAGDSLGATHEFRSWDAIVAEHEPGWRLRDIVGGGAFGWDPGAATDDTDLTLAVLAAYVAPDGFDLRAAADNMLAWRNSRPRDIGGATLRGLDRYAASGDPRRAGAGPGAAGNGSLMRCLPTALARADRAARVAESAEISAVTHDDPLCRWACVAHNELAAALVEGASPPDAVETGLAAAGLAPDPEVAVAVAGAIDAGRALSLAAAADRGGNPFGGSGFVLHSLTLGVAAVLDVRSLEDVLIDVVHLGGDTDTNGAIAGGLLGVRDGATALPARWTDLLQHRDTVLAAVPLLVAGRRG